MPITNSNDKVTRDIRQSLKSLATAPGRYFAGTAKLFLASGTEIVKADMPGLAGMVDVNKELISDVGRFLRNPADAVSKTINKALKSDSYAALQKLAHNAIDDLKTGNFYDKNRDRSSYAQEVEGLLSNFGGFDMTAFDSNGDYVEGGGKSAKTAMDNIAEANADARMGSAIQAIGLSSAGITGTLNANAQNNARLSLKTHSQIMGGVQNMIAQQGAILQSLNAGISSVLEVNREIHQQQQEKFDTAIQLLGEIRDGVKPEPQVSQESETPDFLGPRGELNIAEYLKAVRKNADDRFGISGAIGMMTGGRSIAELVDLFGNNPWELVSTPLLEKMLPESLKEQMKSTERMFQGFFPALLGKLSDRGKRFEDAANDSERKISDLIAGIFGVKPNIRTGIDTTVENTSQIASLTVKTTKAIEEVIPMQLSLIYSAITGRPPMVFNYRSGAFENAYSVLANESHEANDLVGNMGTASWDFRNRAAQFKFSDPEWDEKFDDYLYEWMQDMAKNGRFIDYSKPRKDFMNEMPGSRSLRKDAYYEAITATLKEMPRDELVKLNAELYSARLGKSARNAQQMQELRDSGLDIVYGNVLDPDVKNRIEKKAKSSRYGIWDYDIDEEIDKARKENLRQGMGSSTMDTMSAILNTLRKGIVTYTHIISDDTAGDSENDVPEGLYEILKNQRDALDIARRHDWREIEEAENKRYWEESAKAERRELAGSSDKPMRDTVVGPSTSQEVYRAVQRDYLDAMSPKGRSGNVNLEQQRRIQASQNYIMSQADILKEKFGISKSSSLSDNITGFIGTAPFKIMEDGLKAADSAMFKILYGEDAPDAYNPDNSNDVHNLFGTVSEVVKTEFLGAKTWFAENIGDPIKNYLFNKETGLFPRLKIAFSDTFLVPLKDKAKAAAAKLKTKALGTEILDKKGNGTGRYEGGWFSDQYNRLRDKGEATMGTVGNIVAQSFGEILHGKEGEEYGGIIGKFKRAGEGLNQALFGEDANGDDHGSREKFNFLKREVDKALPDMTIGAGAGLLASFFLPGGPVLGAITGMGAGLIKSSESFKSYLFGEKFTKEKVVIGSDGNPVMVKDPKTGKMVPKTKVYESRKGGFVDSEIYDGLKQYLPKTAIGAGIGAIVGQGLFPGIIGSLGGSLIGSLGGMIASSDKLKRVLFGDSEDETGESGLFSRNFRENLFKTFKERGGGMIIGRIAGGAAGLLAQGLLPGGLGIFAHQLFATLGSTVGLISGPKIMDALFGAESEVEVKDPKTGKMVKKKMRVGGLFGKVYDSVKNDFVNPLGKRINAVGHKIADWFDESIVTPFSHALEPAKQAMRDAGDAIRRSLGNIGDHIKEGLNNVFDKVIGMPLGQFMKEKVIKPLDQATSKFFGFIGRVIGGVISAPFKALEFLVTGEVVEKTRKEVRRDNNIAKLNAKIQKRRNKISAKEMKVKAKEAKKSQSVKKSEAAARALKKAGAVAKEVVGDPYQGKLDANIMRSDAMAFSDDREAKSLFGLFGKKEKREEEAPAAKAVRVKEVKEKRNPPKKTKAGKGAGAAVSPEIRKIAEPVVSPAETEAPKSEPERKVPETRETPEKEAPEVREKPAKRVKEKAPRIVSGINGRLTGRLAADVDSISKDVRGIKLMLSKGVGGGKTRYVRTKRKGPGIIGSVFGFAGTVASTAVSLISAPFKMLGVSAEAVTSMFGSVVKAGAGLLGFIAGTATKTLGAISSTLINMAAGTAKAVSGALGFIPATISGILKTVTGAVGGTLEAAGGIAGGIASAIGGIVGGAFRAVGGIAKGAFNVATFLPRMALAPVKLGAKVIGGAARIATAPFRLLTGGGRKKKEIRQARERGRLEGRLERTYRSAPSVKASSISNLPLVKTEFGEAVRVWVAGQGATSADAAVAREERKMYKESVKETRRQSKIARKQEKREARARRWAPVKNFVSGAVNMAWGIGGNLITQKIQEVIGEKLHLRGQKLWADHVIPIGFGDPKTSVYPGTGVEALVPKVIDGVSAIPVYIMGTYGDHRAEDSDVVEEDRVETPEAVEERNAEETVESTGRLTESVNRLTDIMKSLADRIGNINQIGKKDESDESAEESDIPAAGKDNTAALASLLASLIINAEAAKEKAQAFDDVRLGGRGKRAVSRAQDAAGRASDAANTFASGNLAGQLSIPGVAPSAASSLISNVRQASGAATAKAGDAVSGVKAAIDNAKSSLEGNKQLSLFDTIPTAARGISHAEAGPSVVGEHGREVVWNDKRAKAKIVGETGPEVVNLEPGDNVIPNHKLPPNMRGNSIGRYASGTSSSAAKRLKANIATHAKDAYRFGDLLLRGLADVPYEAYKNAKYLWSNRDKAVPAAKKGASIAGAKLSQFGDATTTKLSELEDAFLKMTAGDMDTAKAEAQNLYDQTVDEYIPEAAPYVKDKLEEAELKASAIGHLYMGDAPVRTGWSQEKNSRYEQILDYFDQKAMEREARREDALGAFEDDVNNKGWTRAIGGRLAKGALKTAIWGGFWPLLLPFTMTKHILSIGKARGKKRMKRISRQDYKKLNAIQKFRYNKNRHGFAAAAALSGLGGLKRLSKPLMPFLGGAAKLGGAATKLVGQGIGKVGDKMIDLSKKKSKSGLINAATFIPRTMLGIYGYGAKGMGAVTGGMGSLIRGTGSLVAGEPHRAVKNAAVTARDTVKTKATEAVDNAKQSLRDKPLKRRFFEGLHSAGEFAKKSPFGKFIGRHAKGTPGAELDEHAKHARDLNDLLEWQIRALDSSYDGEGLSVHEISQLFDLATQRIRDIQAKMDSDPGSYNTSRDLAGYAVDTSVGNIRRILGMTSGDETGAKSETPIQTSPEADALDGVRDLFRTSASANDVSPEIDSSNNAAEVIEELSSKAIPKPSEEDSKEESGSSFKEIFSMIRDGVRSKRDSIRDRFLMPWEKKSSDEGAADSGDSGGEEKKGHPFLAITNPIVAAIGTLGLYLREIIVLLGGKIPEVELPFGLGSKKPEESDSDDAEKRKIGVFDNFKKLYRRIDRKAESSGDAAEEYDKAIQQAKTPEEAEAIQASQQMNVNNNEIEKAEEEEKKGGILSKIMGLFGAGGLLGTVSSFLTGAGGIGGLAKTALGGAGAAIPGILGGAKAAAGAAAGFSGSVLGAGLGLAGAAKSFATGDVLHGTADLARVGTGVASKFLTFFSKAATKLFQTKAVNSLLIKVLGNGGATGIQAALRNGVAKFVNGLASGSIASLGAKLAKANMIVMVAVAAADVVSGMTKASEHFNVMDSEVTSGMRLAAGLAKGLSGLAFGLIPVDWFAQFLWKLFASKEEKDKLKSDQEKYKGMVAKFNEKNGTNLTVEQYQKEYNEDGTKKTHFIRDTIKGAAGFVGGAIKGAFNGVSGLVLNFAGLTAKMVTGDLKGLWTYDLTKHIDDKNPLKFLAAPATFVAKLGLLFPTILTWLGKNVLMKTFGVIKTGISNAIGGIMEIGDIAGFVVRGDPLGLLKYDPTSRIASSKDSLMYPFVHTAFTGAKFGGLILSVYSWIGHKMADMFAPTIDSIGKNASVLWAAIPEIADLAASGHPIQLWSIPTSAGEGPLAAVFDIIGGVIKAIGSIFGIVTGAFGKLGDVLSAPLRALGMIKDEYDEDGNPIEKKSLSQKVTGWVGKHFGGVGRFVDVLFNGATEENGFADVDSGAEAKKYFLGHGPAKTANTALPEPVSSYSAGKGPSDDAHRQIVDLRRNLDFSKDSSRKSKSVLDPENLVYIGEGIGRGTIMSLGDKAKKVKASEIVATIGTKIGDAFLKDMKKTEGSQATVGSSIAAGTAVAMAEIQPASSTTTTSSSGSLVSGIGSKLKSFASKIFGRGPVKPMSQRDSRWADSSNNMADDGCGPTAAAMVASAYGRGDPGEADRMSRDMGMRAPDGGTNPDFFGRYASAKGFGMKEGPVDSDAIKDNLSMGRPVVMMGKGGDFGGGTHYLVADKTDGKDGVGIVDPLNGNRKTTSMSSLGRNASTAVYSYGKGPKITPLSGDAPSRKDEAEVERSEFGRGASDGGYSTNEKVAQAQRGLWNAMKSVERDLVYDQSGDKQNPDKGSGSCASTVAWAYRKTLGITPGGKSGYARSRDQYKDSNFTRIYERKKGGPEPDFSKLQVGDIVYFNGDTSYFQPGRVPSLKHTEMYGGDGKDWSHGGGSDGKQKGPKLYSVSAKRKKSIMVINRYTPFMVGSGFNLSENANTSGSADMTSSVSEDTAATTAAETPENDMAQTYDNPLDFVKSLISSVINPIKDAFTVALGGTPSSSAESSASTGTAEDGTSVTGDNGGVTATADSASSTAASATATNTGKFPKYALSERQIKGIANILQNEQGDQAGWEAEASLMANLVDNGGDKYATVDRLIKKATGTWFADGAIRYNNPGKARQGPINAARSVLVEGRRTIPRYVNEHDMLSKDIGSVSNDGKTFDKYKKDQYIPNKTKISQNPSRFKNPTSYTFYTFPSPKSDPFGYTSEAMRKKWGDDHYDVSTKSSAAGKGPAPAFGKGVWDKDGDETEISRTAKEIRGEEYGRGRPLHVGPSWGSGSANEVSGTLSEIQNINREIERTVQNVKIESDSKDAADRIVEAINSIGAEPGTQAETAAVNASLIAALGDMIAVLKSIDENTKAMKEAYSKISDDSTANINQRYSNKTPDRPRYPNGNYQEDDYGADIIRRLSAI